MAECQITATQVKDLREKTGVGMMDCKRALEETAGDLEKAETLLNARGLATAQKREDRVASQGVIESYLHIGKQIGALVEVNCETDFVARNAEFQEFAHIVALQIAACNPTYLDRESVPAEVVECEKDKYRTRCETEGKPEKVWDRIIEGMLEKYCQEACLLEQPFIKDPSFSVAELLAQVSAKLGEKLQIKRYTRFQVDEDIEE